MLHFSKDFLNSNKKALTKTDPKLKQPGSRGNLKYLNSPNKTALGQFPSCQGGPGLSSACTPGAGDAPALLVQAGEFQTLFMNPRGTRP